MDAMAWLKNSLSDKYSIVAATYLLSWITILISLTGIGFPIMTYMFNQAGVLDDLENGILLSKTFYNPNLLTLPDFAWIASPFTNLVNYISNSLFLTPNSFECRILNVVVNCTPSTHLTVGGYPFLISDFAVIIWFLASLIIFYWLISKISKNRFLALLLSTSYPFVYALSRGNPDVLASILLACLIISILNKKVILSFILVAFLTAIKIPFGLLLVPLVFAYPKIKNFLTFITVTGLSYIVPLLIMKSNGSILSQLNVFSTLVKRYNIQYAINDAGLMHSTSLLSFSKVALFYLSNFFGIGINTNSFKFATYFAIAALVFIYTAIRIWPILITLRNQKMQDLLIDCLLICIILIILLPTVSQDYRLSLLIPLLAVKFRNYFDSKPIIFVICLILMSKNFMQITFPLNSWGTTIGALLNPIIMLILLHILINKINQKALKLPI